MKWTRVNATAPISAFEYRPVLWPRIIKTLAEITLGGIQSNGDCKLNHAKTNENQTGVLARQGTVGSESTQVN